MRNLKKMSKNELMNVVLIGKSPKLHQILFYYNPYGYNSGTFGWNWDVYRNYDFVNNVNFDLLFYNRNVPKKSIDIDNIVDKMNISFSGYYKADQEKASHYLVEIVKKLKEIGVL